MKVYNKKIIADGKKLISIKNGEGGISRLCPLPRKNAYEKRLVRFFNTFLYLVISFWPNDEEILCDVRQQILPKIAYDKIIFVRNKGAEAEHSTPM